MKVEPGRDLSYVAAVRERYPDLHLMVDANGSYGDEAAGRLGALDGFGLSMIEQPLSPDDLAGHAALSRAIKTPVCLDESVTTPRGAALAIDMGACAVLNIKIGRVGGLTAAMDIEALARSRNIPVWCGGMLESGIGRAHNIALATLAGFTCPGDLSASRRYWEEDIIDPEVVLEPGGTIKAPGGPGIGFTPKWELIERLCERKASFG